jgi:hypothetical protein
MPVLILLQLPRTPYYSFQTVKGMPPFRDIGCTQYLSLVEFRVLVKEKLSPKRLICIWRKHLRWNCLQSCNSDRLSIFFCSRRKLIILPVLFSRQVIIFYNGALIKLKPDDSNEKGKDNRLVCLFSSYSKGQK